MLHYLAPYAFLVYKGWDDVSALRPSARSTVIVGQRHWHAKYATTQHCNGWWLRHMLLNLSTTHIFGIGHYWHWQMIQQNWTPHEMKLHIFPFTTRRGCFYMPLSSHGVASDGKKNLHISCTSMSRLVNLIGGVKAKCVRLPQSNRPQTRQHRLSGGCSRPGLGLGTGR